MAQKLKILISSTIFALSLTALLPSMTLAASSCTDSSSAAGINKCLKSDPIVTDLNTIVTFLAGAVGIVTVGMIILGGIQYSLARNKPEDVAAARKRVFNAIVALIIFMLMYAFLEWLIPGGVFG